MTRPFFASQPANKPSRAKAPEGNLSTGIARARSERLPLDAQRGRREPEVRLVAGARAFICDSCIATLDETFSASPS